MATSSRTVRGSYVFKVSEYGDGTPWISLEPRSSPPAELRDFLIGFDLAKGVPFAKAKEIAKYLNQNLKDLSLTIFGGDV